MPEWLKITIVVAVAVAAIAITIATVGTGMPAIAGIIYGTFSAGAQIASNKKHGAETLKNVAGAFVGGFISGASLGIPVGQIVGGFINAGINEIENVMLHNPDNMPFSVIGMIYEGVIYSGANLAQSAIPIFPLQMGQHSSLTILHLIIATPIRLMMFKIYLIFFRRWAKRLEMQC